MELSPAVDSLPLAQTPHTPTTPNSPCPATAAVDMPPAALFTALLVVAHASVSAARTVAPLAGGHRRSMLGASAGPTTWDVQWGLAYGERGLEALPPGPRLHETAGCDLTVWACQQQHQCSTVLHWLAPPPAQSNGAVFMLMRCRSSLHPALPQTPAS